MKLKNDKSGFSLVEIAFAMLVLGLGLLSIVNCFPSGLRASMEAHNDAVSALFADSVFSTARIGSMAVMDESDDWASAQAVRDQLGDMLEGGTFEFNGESGSLDAIVSDFPNTGQWSDPFDYPLNSGDQKLDKIRYKLEVNLSGRPRLAEVVLHVKAGESGGRTRTFVTEIYGAISDIN